MRGKKRFIEVSRLVTVFWSYLCTIESILSMDAILGREQMDHNILTLVERERERARK